MSGVKKKLVVIGAILLVIALGALIDFLISLSYKIEFVTIERQGEAVYDEDGQELPADTGVADGETRMRFVVRVTQNGRPKSGHTLYVRTNRNVIGRVTTNENGEAEFIYRCYRAGSGGADDVLVTVEDEDNSVFVAVSATAEYTLAMAEPASGGDGGNMTTDDIFYDI